MSEGIQKINASNEKSPLRTFRDGAFFASALLAVSPEGAKAWDSTDLIPQAQIEKIFDEIKLPSPTELKDVTVTYVRPSQNGKYVVQIRQEHRRTDKVYAPGDLAHTAAIQSEIYETIKTIEDRQMGTTYLPEGYSDTFITQLLIPDAQNIKAFKQIVATHIEALAAGEVSITDLVKEFGKEHTRKTGTTFSRMTYGDFVAAGWHLLDTASNRNGIVVDDDTLGALKSLVGEDPEVYLNFYQGGLVRAYNDGYITNVVGCENHNLFKESMSYEEVIAINPEREKIVAGCFVDQLQQTSSAYVVTVYGGQHNFAQEILDETGYIVLTPKSYSIDGVDKTID